MYLLKSMIGTRYLLLFGLERYNAIHDRINYLINEEGGITYTINHNFAKVRIESYNSLTKEKALTFHNVIILIKSVVNKNQNNYYIIYF